MIVQHFSKGRFHLRLEKQLWVHVRHLPDVGPLEPLLYATGLGLGELDSENVDLIEVTA